MNKALIPVVKTLGASLTPVEVFHKIARDPYSIFLDSGMDAENLGRYSVISYDPFLVFKSKADRCTILRPKTGELEEFRGNPFDQVKSLLAQYPTTKNPEGPPIQCGAIGYFGYDLGNQLETLPNLAIDDIQAPDCIIGFYDTTLVYDHIEGVWYLSTMGDSFAQKGCEQDAFDKRIAQFSKLLTSELNQGNEVEHSGNVLQTSSQQPLSEKDLKPNFAPLEYQQAVQKARDYIAAGDIFQVNLSQRFQAKWTGSPWELYRNLRNINPAPFASYLNYPEVVVASASPERYLLVQNRRVETRPIKGTRPRGTDSESDHKWRQELINSEKDRAELVMIVDLERNDLGRVCQIGTVKVPDLIRLEEYPTVFHLVSTVEGVLEAGNDVMDLLKASFPGGSITGAPKIRAMEIIEEIEPVKRGIYTGSIGYIDFSGDADLNIVIRTLVFSKDQVYYQVGGGITADSDPVLEYEETLTKGSALRRALLLTANQD